MLRHPIYFGQKDLSSTGEGFESDLVEKLVGEKLRALRRQIEAQRQRVRDVAARFLRLGDTAEQRIESEREFKDASLRLEMFKNLGIADRLEKQNNFQKDENELDRMKDVAESFVSDLEELIAGHEDDLRNAASYVSKQNSGFFGEYYAEYANLVDKLELVKKTEREVRDIISRLQAKREEFDGMHSSFREEFSLVQRQLDQELKQTQTTAAMRAEDFLLQQKRKTKAEQMLKALTRQESQQRSLHDELLAEIARLNDLWQQEFNTIKDELDRVNAGNTVLKIEAEFKADKESAIALMRQFYRGNGFCETTFRAVMQSYSDFGKLFSDLPQALEKVVTSRDAFKKIFMENLAEFVSWQVPNRFVIRYHKKELKNHSLGQRASALLLYILSLRQNDVIIIDQPEDDLDNQTIYDDVIKLLRDMKRQVQFIFATHNANFPVLGDAEQVHACRYHNERVFVRNGSIDARPVQNDIIGIMEGGQEAFNRRNEVYNLWKSPN